MCCLSFQRLSILDPTDCQTVSLQKVGEDSAKVGKGCEETSANRALEPSWELPWRQEALSAESMQSYILLFIPDAHLLTRVFLLRLAFTYHNQLPICSVEICSEARSPLAFKESYFLHGRSPSRDSYRIHLKTNQCMSIFSQTVPIDSLLDGCLHTRGY